MDPKTIRCSNLGHRPNTIFLGKCSGQVALLSQGLVLSSGVQIASHMKTCLLTVIHRVRVSSLCFQAWADWRLGPNKGLIEDALPPGRS